MDLSKGVRFHSARGTGDEKCFRLGNFFRNSSDGFWTPYVATGWMSLFKSSMCSHHSQFRHSLFWFAIHFQHLFCIITFYGSLEWDDASDHSNDILISYY